MTRIFVNTVDSSSFPFLVTFVLINMMFSSCCCHTALCSPLGHHATPAETD